MQNYFEDSQIKLFITRAIRRKHLYPDALEQHPETEDGNEARTKLRAAVSDLIDFKREKREDEQRQSLLYFSIGLVLALLSMVWIFNLYFEQAAPYQPRGISIEDRYIPTMDIPVTEQVPPIIPIQEVPIMLSKANFVEDISAAEIKEIQDNMEAKGPKLNLDNEMRQDGVLAQKGIVVDNLMAGVSQQEEKIEEIFEFVERQPEPMGGMDAFYKRLYEIIQYPRMAEQMGIEGRVFVSFVVEQDGSMSHFEVLKGIGGGCEEEAIRALKASGYKWNPGANRGRPVRVLFKMPVTFKISK